MEEDVSVATLFYLNTAVCETYYTALHSQRWPLLTDAI